MPVQHLHDLHDAPFPGQDSCLTYSVIKALLTELKGHTPKHFAGDIQNFGGINLWRTRSLKWLFTSIYVVRRDL